jgi:hypothetical protein
MIAIIIGTLYNLLDDIGNKFKEILQKYNIKTP